MAKHVRCSYCGKHKWMEYCYYKKNLHKYGVVNLLGLNNLYVCKKCFKRLQDINKPSGLRDTPEFKTLQQTLQIEVDLLLKRGLNNPIAMKNFQMNVKAILDNRYIINYDYEISNNELVGIFIKKMPLYGDMLIKLDTKGNR